LDVFLGNKSEVPRVVRIVSSFASNATLLSASLDVQAAVAVVFNLNLALSLSLTLAIIF